MTGSSTLGLRERKQIATEIGIQKAAVAIALEKGAQQVTVEEICARALISRSTFFNYFSQKDQAIIGKTITLPTNERAFKILAAAGDNVTLGAFRVLLDNYSENGVDEDLLELRGRLVREQKCVVLSILGAVIRPGYVLTSILNEYLRQNPRLIVGGDPEKQAALIATAVFGVITSCINMWVSGTNSLQFSEKEFKKLLLLFSQILNEGVSCCQQTSKSEIAKARTASAVTQKTGFEHTPDNTPPR